jgi:hypothetical protein
MASNSRFFSFRAHFVTRWLSTNSCNWLLQLTVNWLLNKPVTPIILLLTSRHSQRRKHRSLSCSIVSVWTRLRHSETAAYPCLLGIRCPATGVVWWPLPSKEFARYNTVVFEPATSQVRNLTCDHFQLTSVAFTHWFFSHLRLETRISDLCHISTFVWLETWLWKIHNRTLIYF